MLNKHVRFFHLQKEGIYAVAFDNVDIVYKMNEEKTHVTIVRIFLVGEEGTLEGMGDDFKNDKVKTAAWLAKMTKILGMDLDHKEEEEEEQKEEH